MNNPLRQVLNSRGGFIKPNAPERPVIQCNQRFSDGDSCHRCFVDWVLLAPLESSVQKLGFVKILGGAKNSKYDNPNYTT
jgi:hypothetical protein